MCGGRLPAAFDDPQYAASYIARRERQPRRRPPDGNCHEKSNCFRESLRVNVMLKEAVLATIITLNLAVIAIVSEDAVGGSSTISPIPPHTNLNDTAEEFALAIHLPLICVLKNLSTNESTRLERYLEKKTYANLKKMIDAKMQQFPGITSLEMEQLKYAGFIEQPTPIDELLTNFTINERELSLIAAYQNASIYNIIRAVWNARISELLPQLDQLVILEYFHEKRMDELRKMGMLARLWAAIKGWFKSKNEDYACDARSPECIRQFIYSLSTEERAAFDRIVESENLTLISHFIDEKIAAIPARVRAEFNQWTEETYLPQALLDIVNNVTDGERMSLQRLREHKLVNALKDYYRDMIEDKTIDEQQEIHSFFLKMNQTFARCYNPMPYKEKLWRLEDGLEDDYF